MDGTLAWPLGPREAQVTHQNWIAFVFPRQDSLQGNPVRRSPDELPLHPVFIQLNLVGKVWRTDESHRGNVSKPILITARGIILSGARQWHVAITEGRATLYCTEYSLDDDEALQLLLTPH